MDVKFLRTLVYLFSGLIIVFLLLILVNYVGTLSGSRRDLPGQEEADGKLPVSEELARQSMNASRYAAGGSGSMIPPQRKVVPASSVNSAGAIMLVREKEFSGVAEAPKDMMSILSELSGGDKKKPAPIALKDSDLDKEIKSLRGDEGKEPPLKTSSMPEMGRGAAQEGVTLLSAPVDYKLFKSSATWKAFADSRKLGAGQHDFSSQDLLILVSLSDFPNRIFIITGVERVKKETVVSYRVDPLAMSAELPPGQRDSYSSAPVPKGAAVRLKQVP
ncbi:MAG: hypothetical protein HY550_12030 [Elusimicrobia bacterium]|nr:hypothetical protein [Elusimicrobiota bacterium]